MDIDFIERLERKLEDDLPGQRAQLLMAPVGRRDSLIPPDEYKEASVLALLFLKSKEWHIAFIQRTTTVDDDPHSGQISLPGGQVEEADITHSDCAIRETQEEIGINAEDIGLIGELTPLYISVSNFLVYPFVGFTQQEPVFEPQPTEVSAVIEVPLDTLINERFRAVKEIPVRGGLLKDVPCFEIEDKVVWGATAMMMSEFAEILKEVY